MIKTLQWDSDFFNLKVGEIRYDDNYEEKDFSSYDLIYLISNEDMTLDLPGFENTFSETKVTFIKNIENITPSIEPIFRFDEVEINKEQLYLLAYESGKNSRFLLDTKFTEEHFKKLYQTWIDNSVNKKFADDVLVYFDENQLKGFVTYKVNNTTASVGLIAVDSQFQGKGIGAKLLIHLEDLLFKQEIKQLTIPTQLSNIQACNFYSKQGYIIKNKTAIKHYWKNDTI
ncbi:GNAT family N-acetyltransferase [Flavobacterium sp. PLA-1-15]|uniref:GNAT family N-acetyltransferase n=1 Tax=Flavobacterium sp. PLA-1-15 TaxID=3380533 RepID=UPI003B7FA472